MSSLNTIAISIGLLLMLAGFIIVVLGIRRFQAREFSNRLSDFVAQESSWETTTQRQSRVMPRDMSGSFFERVITPRLIAMGDFFYRISPRGVIESIETRLVLAGNPYGMGPRGFFGFQLLMIALGVLVIFVVLTVGLGVYSFLLSILILIAALTTPQLFLIQSIRKRQDAVRKRLPDALDMLSVCASAGLGFDQSMQHVSEQWDNELSQEFSRTIKELQMGFSRQQALRNMAQRVDIIELSTFVSLIVQAEQLGMSISETLHSQADQMRMFRRFRAEEQIQKIPTKMLFPIAFLIFPAIMVVVLGPALPTLFSLFSGF